MIERIDHRLVTGKYDVHALSVRDGRLLTSLPRKFPVAENGSLVGVRVLKKDLLKTEVPAADNQSYSFFLYAPTTQDSTVNYFFVN